MKLAVVVGSAALGSLEIRVGAHDDSGLTVSVGKVVWLVIEVVGLSLAVEKIE